ncbi:hypothetical protein DL95DRAFT_418030 [Leptodontidium sp. 2 PMI_412]|nr:hypothetical protein DL95DRAFT_418030 [Leptodontidium sp. 2 PMI_412]
MYLGGDYFSLNSAGLVKCKPQDDKDGGGYIVRFMCDQQGCGYWSLYLAPGGYSCVMDCPRDVECWECQRQDQRGHPAPEAHKILGPYNLLGLMRALGDTNYALRINSYKAITRF